MKSNYLLFLMMLFSGYGFAQNYQIGGVVTEAATGMPIPGVNIQVNNMTLGTTTDLDGRFTLANIPGGSTVVFTYIGFSEFSTVVNSTNLTMSVPLAENASTLDEVVVIGYGTQLRREVTGAVSTVDSETIMQIRPVLASQALQGTVAGVSVNQTSGAPGAGFAIRIRGIATNGNNSPTVIIDGYVGNLDLLNPDDIETMTILKDAQAAIYGTIGANGIVLITTKSGKRNSKTRISYDTYTGFQETSRKLNLLNATEYALLLNEAYANGGQEVPFPNVSQLGEGTDWQDEIFDDSAPIVNHNLSFSGGSEKMSYRVSGSHLDQLGIIGGEKSAFLRNTARLALDADLSSKIRMKTNVTYTYFNRKTLNEFGLGSALFNAINTPATLAPYDENGDFTLVPATTGFGNEIINPLAQIANTFNNYDFRGLNGMFGLEYKLLKDLTINSRIGVNSSNNRGRSFAKQISYGGKVFDVAQSSVTQSAINDNNYTYDLWADYEKEFDETHNFKLSAGTTVFRTWGEGLFATGFGVPNNTWENADIDLTTSFIAGNPNASYSYDERRLSYFGRFEYDFKGKYLLSALLRRDSSTRFGPTKRIAYFPSFSAGWIVSDEDFFSNSGLVNFLKFRASYGTLGNDEFNNNLYVSLLNGEATYVFNNTLTNGTATGIVTNPDLQWEEAKKFNAGVDLRLFNNKIEITADYFNDVRDNLLIVNLPVSGIVGVGAPGAGAPTVNAGEVKNYGAEFAITYNDKIGDNFEINVHYNVALIKNKVTRVINGTGYVEGGSFGVGQPAMARMEEGQPLGYFYGYVTDGIFQNQAEIDAHPSQIALGATSSPGDIRYVDINNDGVINSNDRTNVGDPIPAATMGFNLTMKYKNFDFSTYAFANIGNDMVRNYERVLSDANRLDYNLDRWTGEGTSNTVPRVTTGATGNNVFSDYFVEDASFVRINKVELGYSLDAKAIETAGMSSARIYVGVNNLYTFTKYMGYDPAASTGAPIGGGIDQGFYPVPRTYMIGASINF